MKLREIIARVDKQDKFKSEVDISELREDMQLPYEITWHEQDRLVCYLVCNWYCTDSYVGCRVYFLDNEPVAVSWQHGRKSREDIKWVSEELYIKTREYIISLGQLPHVPVVPIADLDEEMGDTYKVLFHTQMMDNHFDNAMYSGQKVNVIKHRKGYNEDKENNFKFHPETVQIQLPDNTKKWVETHELDFPYNIVN